MIPSLLEYESMMRDAITAPDARSQQVRIGASEVGGCGFCVGYTLARKFFDLPKRQGFGYAAWIGTGMHYWLEKKLALPVESLREHKVTVGELEGYGTVKGTADLVLPSWRRLVDYKFPGEYSTKKLLLAKSLDPDGPWAPTNYRFQQQLLAHGLRAEGIEIDVCTIHFFPRHTNSYGSVLAFEEPYSEHMVTAAMDRLAAILEDVLDGRLDEIESDDSCYLCEREGRPYIKGYTKTKAKTGATA